MSKRLRSTLPIALVLCLLAAPFALRAGSQDTTSESPISPTSPLLLVRTVRVAMQDTFEVEARLAGRLVARRASELGFERSGRLVSVAVDEGARVAVGDLLAELDTRELRAQQRELRARVQASDARLDLARATAKRRTDLHAAEYLSSQGLDEAVSNERAAVAQLAAERAALERVEVALELSELRAPYAAIVTARSVDEGTVVSPGQTVLRVLEDGVQEVRIGVPPGLAASLVVGESYGVGSWTPRAT